MTEINQNLNVIEIGGFIGVRPHRCKSLVNETGNLDICRSKEYVSFFGDEDEHWVYESNYSKNNFLYIDTVKMLCGEEKLLKNCEVRKGMDLIFYDGGHFSLFGSEYVSDLMFNKYKEELSSMGIGQ
jgi:hypothetical protein